MLSRRGNNLDLNNWEVSRSFLVVYRSTCIGSGCPNCG